MTGCEAVDRAFEESPEDSNLAKLPGEEHAEAMEKHEAKPEKGAPKNKRKSEDRRDSHRAVATSTDEDEPQENSEEYLAFIPMDSIVMDEKNPRKNARQGVESLKASIKQLGQQDPITVVRLGDKYSVIDGRSRCLAMQDLGKKLIKAIVKDVGEKARRISSLVANSVRLNLNPFDLAEACKDLMEAHGMTQKEVGAILGKPESTISEYLALHSLQEGIREDFEGYFSSCNSDDLDSRSRRKIPSFWTMKEISKIKYGPYQERFYRRIKRAYAKKAPPRGEIQEMVSGINSEEFTRMPEGLKAAFFESDFLGWKHLTAINNPHALGGEFTQFADIELPERKKRSVARWVERHRKNIEKTKAHLLKLLRKERAQRPREQAAWEEKEVVDDVAIFDVVRETGGLEEKLRNLRSILDGLGQKNPALLRQLRMCVASLRLTAESLLSAVDETIKRAGKEGPKAGRGKQDEEQIESATNAMPKLVTAEQAATEEGR